MQELWRLREMKSSICVIPGKQTSFRIVSLMLAVAPLWLMLATANTSAHAQMSNKVSDSSTSAAPSPADWTQFLRDNMQRWNPYETILGVKNVGELKLKWSFTTSRLFQGSSPAVVNGVVYIASQDGNLYALNANTGAKLWSDANTGCCSSPAVANGVVYADDGVDMYALNATTGAKLWSYPIGSTGFSSPAVANGVVYDSLYALNASTGAKLWSYPPAAGEVFAPTSVANGVVYVSDEFGDLYALNASTGTLRWSYYIGPSFPVAGFVYSAPLIANGVVYIGSFDGSIYALNASTGVLLWSEAAGYVGEFSPAVANGVVYFGGGVASGNPVDTDYKLYALNASTGAKLWSYAIGTNVALAASPAVANGVVYLESSDGTMLALNASTGARLWSYATPDVTNETLISGPAVVNGTVYIASGKTVYAFGLGEEADLYLRIRPTATTVTQGELLTYAFPVWNLGPDIAEHEVLTTQVPKGTTFDYIRISGTPGLGTCTHPSYGGTGQIVCHEGDGMAPNTTWTVRLTVKVTAPAGTVITENAATIADTPDPNLANNTATVSIKVQ
jgi:outer membrane protein assembly factor BamB